MKRLASALVCLAATILGCFSDAYVVRSGGVPRIEQTEYLNQLAGGRDSIRATVTLAGDQKERVNLLKQPERASTLLKDPRFEQLDFSIPNPQAKKWGWIGAAIGFALGFGVGFGSYYGTQYCGSGCKLPADSDESRGFLNQMTGLVASILGIGVGLLAGAIGLGIGSESQRKTIVIDAVP